MFTPRSMILLSCLVLGCASAFAMTESREVGGTVVTVYAPDWSWQSGAVNVLVTVENRGEVPVSCELVLMLPVDSADHFEFEEGALSTSVEVAAGESGRAAFTNLVPMVGHELQTYPLQIVAHVGNAQAVFEYPLQTIRGPVVSGAKWAMFLPAVLCALWCVTFLVALRRFAKPGAWRETAELPMDGAAHEAWMDETP